jgi:hypothetical protein
MIRGFLIAALVLAVGFFLAHLIAMSLYGKDFRQFERSVNYEARLV